MTATLDWFGCATFRLTVGKLVIFLDAYLDRVPAAPQVGLRPEEAARAADVVDPAGTWEQDLVAGRGELLRQALTVPPDALRPAVVNGARWRAAEVPAVNGHGTARGVASSRRPRRSMSVAHELRKSASASRRQRSWGSSARVAASSAASPSSSARTS